MYILLFKRNMFDTPSLDVIRGLHKYCASAEGSPVKFWIPTESERRNGELSDCCYFNSLFWIF